MVSILRIFNEAFHLITESACEKVQTNYLVHSDNRKRQWKTNHMKKVSMSLLCQLPSFFTFYPQSLNVRKPAY